MKKVRFFQSIQFKFVITYTLLIAIAMQMMGMYFVGRLETQLTDNFSTSLVDKTSLLLYNIEQEFERDRERDDLALEEDISILLNDFSSDGLMDLLVIDQNSTIIATADASNLEVVGKRNAELEVTRALSSGTSQSKIILDTESQHRVLVIAIPIMKGNQSVSGVMYISASMEDMYFQMTQINLIFATGSAIAIGVTFVLGVLLARTITKPIWEMRKQALEMAKGNFSRKVKVYGNDEIGQLSESFNNLSRKLQRANATTEGERRKLASVLTHMTDGVIATDRQGQIILLNDPAEEMLNVSHETALNENLLTVLGIEDIYTLEDLFDEPDDVLLDYSTRSKPYILRASFSVIQKDTGKINGLIVVLYDVTEQEKIDQERREFVANVSHELRTPLTTMSSYLEALSEGAWKDENLAPNFLSVTKDETDRMIRLVNDLLQLSKMDSDDYMLKKELVNFTDLLSKIIDRFEMSKKQNVHFSRKFSKKSRFVDIDSDKITQLLYNIISNAMKYSPEGGTITYRLKERGDWLEVSISDQGMGIPKENLGKIFDRFYRVDGARTRKLGGTGLGLAIAREIIKAHGGRIWAASEIGKGTTIYFTLPLDSEQEDEWL